MHIIYILFLTSGIIKTFFPYFSIYLPIDLTLIFSVILVFDVFIYQIFSKFKIRYKINSLISIGVLLTFYMFMIISLLYSPSDNYSMVKTTLFITNIIAFGYPILKNVTVFKLYFKTLVILTIIYTFCFLPFMMMYLKDEANLKNTVVYQMMGLYLSIGNLIGLSLLLVLVVSNLYKSNIIKWLITLLLFILLMIIGARGPLLFFLILYIMYLIGNFIKDTFMFKKYSNIFILNRIFASGLVLVIFIVIFFIFSDSLIILLDRTLARFSVLTTDDMGDSMSHRMQYFIFSIDNIFCSTTKFIFGHGIGSFGILYNGIDINDYPHNIIFELLFELGVIGLILFVLFFSLVLRRSKLNSNSGIPLVILMYLVLNAMKSSSLIDHRMMFFVLAIHQMLKKEEINI